jgi:hypothetical protein
LIKHKLYKKDIILRSVVENSVEKVENLFEKGLFLWEKTVI